MPKGKGIIKLFTLYSQLKPWHNLPVSETQICQFLNQLHVNKSWWFPVYYITKQVETSPLKIVSVAYNQHILKLFGYKLVQFNEFNNINYPGRNSITILNKTFTMVKAELLLPLFKKFKS
jgi:hypothetical protein